MAYANFTLEMVRRELGLTIELAHLFPGAGSVNPPPWLGEQLARGTRLALRSEKARCEFMVAPVLLALRELLADSFSIYSGERLDVDPARGLIGECDFLLTATPPLPDLEAPFVVVLEAKKGEIEAGLGQCAAQMVGAQLFNEREGRKGLRMMGCVTSGEIWQFLELEETTLRYDQARYYLNDLGALLGALKALLASVIAPQPAAA